jgi:predicted permease
MSLWSRLRNTFSPGRQTAEIDEELEFHLEMSARDKGDARQARLRLGSPANIREETRAAGIVGWLDSLRQDVRYGLRQLGRTRVLTAAILASLAIGIGVNTTIFSVADAALLKALPVEDPESLRVVQWTIDTGWPKELANSHTGTTNGDPNARMEGSSFGPILYRTLARDQTAFQSLFGFSDAYDAAVAAGPQVAGRTKLQYVSANFFRALGVPLELGPGFDVQDDRVGSEPVVILSHRYWLANFGGRADAIGQTVRVNNVAARVVGVAGPGFYGVNIGQWTDVYAPLAARVAFSIQDRGDAPLGEDDQYWWVRLMARLRPDVDEAAARAQLTVFYQQTVTPPGLDLDPSRIPTLSVLPGRRGSDPLGGEDSRRLWVLLLLAGLVLLIVCANVANLLLARAVTRQRESAVRLSLGATRLRLLRQQIVESMLLASLGGALGLMAGYLLMDAARPLSQDVLGAIDLALDLRILAFTACVSLLTALLFGLAPALRAAQSDWSEGLKSQSRSVFGGRLRLPKLLVVVQLALCVAVLVCAGLLTRSLANLKGIDIGFDRENLVYATVNPWRAGYERSQVLSYVERVQRELAAQPGIVGVSTIDTVPLSGGASWSAVNLPGSSRLGDPLADKMGQGDELTQVMLNSVGENLFDVIGVPLLTGRNFHGADFDVNSDAIVVNELFVQRFFPNENPLGRRFGLDPDHDDSYQVVGVVANSLYNSLRDEVRPTAYRPLKPASRSGASTTFALRATLDSGQVAEKVRAAASLIDPSVPVDEIRTQTALIDRLLRAERMLSTLSTTFGSVALCLAAVGLGGLLAYAVARRRNEIGVRIALGAAPRSVARMVLGDSLRLVAIGALIGLPGAYAIARLLERNLYGLQPADPLTALAALAILAAVAALAAWLPASRAARIDPIAALRDD